MVLSKNEQYPHHNRCVACTSNFSLLLITPAVLVGLSIQRRYYHLYTASLTYEAHKSYCREIILQLACLSQSTLDEQTYTKQAKQSVARQVWGSLDKTQG